LTIDHTCKIRLKYNLLLHFIIFWIFINWGQVIQKNSTVIIVVISSLLLHLFHLLLFSRPNSFNLKKGRNIIIENRIYIRVEFTWKKCKTAILLYCFHTAGVLHIFAIYNLLGPGISFYRKSKINIKRKQNYEIGWFYNWPMIISHRLYAFHFTNNKFPL